MSRVLFVTNELYPIARGGIGRLIYNYAMWNAAQPEPAEMHVLMLGLRDEGRWGEDPPPRVPIHDADRLGALRPDQEAALSACRSAAYAETLRPSIRVANALEALYEREDLRFDWIEFPDFMGLAAGTLRRRLADAPALRDARLAVRLHSSMTLIQADEGPAHQPSDWFAAVTDLERYALRHADLVVGHLASIVELNRKGFGFDQGWAERVHVEFPPIALTPSELRAREDSDPGDSVGDAETFVFSSRLQPFKRPELFIRGAVAFARTMPDRHDRFLIISYGWDTTYQNWLGSLIPSDLSDRIRILTKLDADARARVMADAIIVAPSTFESLCLLAYESHLYGRRIILNGTAEAFGDAPFWEDGRTCLLFDGTPLGLADAMRRALSFDPESERALPEPAPYWRTARDALARGAPDAGSPTLDMVVTDIASTPERLEAALSVVDGPWDRSFVFHDRLFDASSVPEASDRVAFLPAFGAGVGRAELEAALRGSRADYVLLAPMDFVPGAAWRASIAAALDRAPDLLAFPMIDDRGRPRGLPLLDCPNLVAQGFEAADGPVILRRETALSLLRRVGPDDDWAVPRLALAAALSAVSAHVPDLPVGGGSSRAPHRNALGRHLSDLVAQERRAHVPHLAAYVASPNEPPGGLPHRDEFAALPRPDGSKSKAVRVGEALSMPVRLLDRRRNGVAAAWLTPVSTTETRWEAGLALERNDGETLHCSLAQTPHGLEIALHEGTHAFRVTSRGRMPWAESDPETPAGRRRLSLLLMLAEHVPCWHAKALFAIGRTQPQCLEDALRREAGRISAMAAMTLDLAREEIAP